MPTKMRKALVAEFGGVEKINIVDSDISEPAAQHVQVKVAYSGFSGADINMRQGAYPMQRKAPLTPGYCLVGSVKINGHGSNKFRVGDVVACLSVYDAEAELANLPEKYLISVPAGMDLQVATALILDWNTAYGMVIRAACVSAGQRVFVHGMSGAVGYAIMILCQEGGAEVYGTASASKHAAIQQLGATPFTYHNKEWMAKMNGLGGADVVFDALGFESWDESYSILKPQGGLLIGYGGNLGSLRREAPRSVIYPTLKLLARNYLKFWSQKRTTFYWISRDQATFEPELKALFKMVQEGKISVSIKQVYDLENIQEAHRSWGKGPGMGSNLIRVAGGQI